MLSNAVGIMQMPFAAQRSTRFNLALSLLSVPCCLTEGS
jgi:hypothetical protein